MKYEIPQELLNAVLRLLGSAKDIPAVSWLELKGLLEALQKLPKIEPKVGTEPKEVKKDAKVQ